MCGAAPGCLHGPLWFTCGMAEKYLDPLNDAVDAVVATLRDCDDWGPSGARAGQYGFDLAADAAALEVLLDEGLRVLSEESGLSGGDRDGPVAVLDPVDGSTNASRGIRYFATSICVVDQGIPVAAVVHDHGSGQRFEAVRGSGACRDYSLLAPRAAVPLAQAVVGINGWPPGRGGWAQFRELGAAALELCAVADGRLDGYVDFSDGLAPWDYLGALLVCAEAGVGMRDAQGRSLIALDHQSRRLPVAAPEPLLSELLSARAALVAQAPSQGRSQVGA